ncbi:hypothetical protein [uncultured Desulfuromusa sp.]|uniref:hypothetical protein n=1 Tax=uncultured Desulfuromusa sp. TaxID=219183 RepID=UPI002AA62254|nr:hypothetical protein [uncultured Desulfuromusa sp.]
MSVALITERIRSSIAAGELPEKPDGIMVDQLTMADLLRDWSDVFPGHSYEEQKKLFGWRGFRNPRFVSQIKRSIRPLCRPHSMQASVKLISPDLFQSIQAIADWYRRQGVAEYDLSEYQFNEQNIESFIGKLYMTTSDYWPLHIQLEDINLSGDLSDLQSIMLQLPGHLYEEDCSGVVEAFLSGSDGVEWLMQHYYGLDDFIDLPDADRELIKQVGFGQLTQQYEKEGKGRSYDLTKLKGHQQTYFGAVWENYQNDEIDPVIISGNGGMENEVPVRRADDIDFCMAYAKAFYRLGDDMPDPVSFEENNNGETETFIHELCEVWRSDHGLQPVDWKTAKSQPEFATPEFFSGITKGEEDAVI